MRLRQKFQNNRKQKDSSLPIVQERKKTTKTATDETPSPNHISEQRLYGLKQYLCEKPFGEDETSTEKHKEWMKTRLHCRKKGDLCKMDLLMDKTLHDCRKLITDNTPVNELIEHYPFPVASPAQLLNEFKRLGNDAEKGVSNFLSQYKDSVNSHLQDRNISPENNPMLPFLMKQSSHMPDLILPFLVSLGKVKVSWWVLNLGNLLRVYIHTFNVVQFLSFVIRNSTYMLMALRFVPLKIL
ncbi:uncharacterized protein LOC143235183 [Tachypleus tridentatus]|uniref:uncharacterized protein LOC143235183 n=1 Tax=Tachypleus tridentatus TaxID=6853 RepID=UPI003FD69244